MARAPKSLSGRWHRHGCLRCHVAYGDGCTSPADDGLCWTCHDGRQRPFDWGQDDPRPCCHDDCFEIYDRTTRVSFRLAGIGPWFKCRTCARLFPHVKPQDRSPA